MKKNGNNYEAVAGKKPILHVLAAKYGEDLQAVAVPMTDAAIRRLVGGRYAVSQLRYQNGKVAAALVSGKDGVAVCGIAGDTLTSLHPYDAQSYSRELSPAEPPKKKSFLGDLEAAKALAAEQNAADVHGDSARKSDDLEV
jgi:hypothetical protein